MNFTKLFSGFPLKGDKTKVKYTLGSKFLTEWMPRVNSSF